VLELPACAPLVNSVHKILERWETDLKDRLEKFDSAPANYIPGVYIEPSFGSSVTIVKYHTIMDPANTPFTSVYMSGSFNNDNNDNNNKLCAWRHDMPRPSPPPPVGAPAPRAPLSRRNVAVVSHAQYVLMVTAAPASRVKAAVSKAAW